jgi:hypothetical protein
VSGVRDPRPDELEASPGRRLMALAQLVGEHDVARWCAELLLGGVGFDDDRRPSTAWLGGPHAVAELQRDDIVERKQDYWFRVWAARGLLYVWSPDAVPAVVSGMTDPAWRVREMCAKVSRRRELGEAAPVLARLVQDPVPRVRAAAVSALGVTAEVDEVPAMGAASDDADRSVRAAAVRALEETARRLDREL